MTDKEALILAKAKQFRERGMPWTHVARAVGLSTEFIRKQLDPAFAEKRREMRKASRARCRAGVRRPSLYTMHHSMPAEEARRALATLPVDTRSQFERWMGDPMPGRSALDNKRMREAANASN